MSDDLVCPSCGADDHLQGERHGDLIRITCSTCNLVWDRDPSPRCRRCNNPEVRPAPQAIWGKARGTQLAVVALRTVHLCPDCDPDLLRRFLDSGIPIPPDENPAADMG
jgi:ssDNA-binding Zn-finger/Zn-ribbon topoisomerase 1